ncbi:PAS domain-containing protein [Nisaea sp.]|uniref:PAS domain-containing protein n=1 Tax=Nisaea sp. TaxID=2024842 RepID=UPI0032EBC215
MDADPRATALLDYWHASVRQGGIPDRDAFDPFNLRQWLGLLSIYEPVAGTLDFRNRLDGTGITDLTGEDWTNGLASEIDARYGTSLKQDLQTAHAAQGPVIHRIAIFQKNFTSAIRLLLPVSSREEGDPSQVFLAIFVDKP